MDLQRHTLLSAAAADTGYFDADGPTGELALQAGNLHGDYWWSTRYYVDERVVRRLEDDEGDPRDDDLLECRRDA